MGAVELVFGRRCRGEDRVPGCVTVWFKGKQGGDFGVEQRDRDPGVLAGDLGRGVALQGERKGKGEAADLWACGSVTERAGCGARTRAPCCCIGEKAGPRGVRNAGLARAGGCGGEVGCAGEVVRAAGGLGLSGKGKRGGEPAGFGNFGLGFGFEFGFWVLGFLFLFLFLSNANSNSNSRQMNSNLNLNSLKHSNN